MSNTVVMVFEDISFHPRPKEGPKGLRLVTMFSTLDLALDHLTVQGYPVLNRNIDIDNNVFYKNTEKGELKFVCRVSVHEVDKYVNCEPLTSSMYKE